MPAMQLLFTNCLKVRAGADAEGDQYYRSLLMRTIRKIFVKLLEQSSKINENSSKADHSRTLNHFMRQFYLQLKSRNELFYEVLQVMLEKDMELFLPHAGVYVLQIVKSLSCDKSKVQEKSFLLLANLTSALFLHGANLPIEAPNGNQAIETEEEGDASFLAKKARRGTRFILDFKNPSNFEYTLLQRPRADLRAYQEEGINWLGFLTRYKLNGALCDDMGLGKTL
jgi:TATA-binding protein-associated factor